MRCGYIGGSIVEGTSCTRDLFGSEACCKFTISEVWSHNQVAHAGWGAATAGWQSSGAWADRKGKAAAYGGQGGGGPPDDDKKWVVVGLNKSLVSIQA
jgi:hypothetical protein